MEQILRLVKAFSTCGVSRALSPILSWDSEEDGVPGAPEIEEAPSLFCGSLLHYPFFYPSALLALALVYFF